MGLFTSDYSSGSSTSSSSFTSWMSREKPFSASLEPRHQPRPKSDILDQKSSSYLDLMMQKCTLNDVMQEFQMNGSDSPYNPDEEEDVCLKRSGPGLPGESSGLGGLGPSALYLRQKSWPAPERTPVPRLPRPRSMLEPRFTHFATSTPVFDDVPPAPFLPEVEGSEALTAEQSRVLHSLPDAVVFSLLRGMRAERRNKLPQECRFCKNNGERQAFYRSHALKDGAGRVACPVLRAFTCRRCGARGDHAHTIKYCPLSTNEERIQSAGMMRSVRMASGRRRHSPPPPAVLEPALGVDDLDPLWTALLHKLSM